MPARPPRGAGWQGTTVGGLALSSLSGASQHIFYYKNYFVGLLTGIEQV